MATYVWEAGSAPTPLSVLLIFRPLVNRDYFSPCLSRHPLPMRFSPPPPLIVTFPPLILTKSVCTPSSPWQGAPFSVSSRRFFFPLLSSAGFAPCSPLAGFPLVCQDSVFPPFWTTIKASHPPLVLRSTVFPFGICSKIAGSI